MVFTLPPAVEASARIPFGIITVILGNGRAALRKSNKLNALYKFSVRCPDEQLYNSTMSKLYTVIIVCREKLHLPLSSTRSAYVFGLDDTKADGDGKVVG